MGDQSVPVSSSIISFASIAISSRGIQVHSVIFAPLRTSLSRHCDLHGYQPWFNRVSNSRPQMLTFFAIYLYIFITFRSSYNVLCCHTMLAGVVAYSSSLTSSSPGYSGLLILMVAHQPPISTPSNTLLQSDKAAALYGWTS
jgi:hypothetical protein